MGERRGTKALELWCRRITEGYPGVSVQNMTTSWRDGLAFCAMIHHFRPDLIDFDNLDKNDVYGNNELAFRIAEQHLGIPALLDAEDMVTYSVPDRLSILTYLSQFYQTLGGSSPVSRTTDTIEEKITQVPESSTEKEASYPGMRKDSCAVCKLPIFLAEKLVLAHVAYHRTCFRCARCNNQLTLGNYYETEEGQYCCETCPDEEISSPTIQNWNESATFTPTIKTDKPFIRDEENMNKGISIHSDPIQHLDHKASFTSTLTAQTSRLQLNFISNQLLAEQDEQIFAVDNSVVNEDPNGFEEDRINLKIESTNSMFLVDHECEKQKEKETEHDLLATFLESKSRKRKSAIEEEITKNLVSTKDYAHDQLNMRREELKADSFHDKLIKNEPVFHNSTKTLLNQIDGHTRADSSSSLVQERRKIFENKEDYVEKNKNGNQNAEILKLKMRNDITENTENSITNSGRTETTVIDQETALKSNFGNSAADSFLIHTAPCAVSLSDTCKVSSKNSMVIVSGEESGEYQACTTFVNGINTPNITTDLNEEYPEDLNPFKNDEEEVADKSVIITNSLRTTIDLTNPFENEEELAEKNETSLPKPATRNKLNNIKANEEFVAEKPIKRRLTAPKINLNPFWSDEDDHDSDLESKEKASEIMPVPKPRTRMCIQRISSDESKLDQNHDQLHVSNDSLRSPDSRISVGGTYKKKKPAPLPPNKKDLPDQRHTSLIPKSQCDSTGFHDSSSPNPSVPKTRKTKPAPPPPPALIPTTSNLKQSSKCETHSSDKKINSWEDQKTNKDEANRNRKSFTHVPCEENFHRKTYVDKSVDGKWKRKKGPVPPCPIPHRRKIKVMSLKDVKLELDEIELQQQGLEKQGVRLEQLIRNKCESRFRTNDICLGTDVEELVLELFALVNEKNELFRRQAELMLLRRQQRLEEEHAEIEYQIRCLMSQHDSTKTDFDKQREEALIQRLVEIVEKRNEIVDCLEMDRRREIEEDRSIHRHMDLFAAKNKNESSSNTVDTAETKKQKQNKLKEKTREKKLKKTFKKDIDKDVDEIELTLKRHNKRKWF